MTRFPRMILILSLLTIAPAFADEQKTEDDVKPAFIVTRKVPRTDQNAAKIRAKEIESIEVRFHPSAAQTGSTALYFEVIHHRPGQTDRPLGGTEFHVKGPKGEDVVKRGLTYDDYQFMTGVLHQDYRKLWGDAINARKGGAGVMTLGGIYLAYWAITGLAEREFKHKALKLVTAGAVKAVELNKGKLGGFPFLATVTIEAGLIYGAYEGLNSLEDWAVYGREYAKREWLHTIVSDAYEFATYGTPIDTKQFDVDAAFDRYQQTVTGNKKPEAPAAAGSTANPSDVPPGVRDIVPSTKDMKFAREAFEKLFTDYYEPYAADAK